VGGIKVCALPYSRCKFVGGPLISRRRGSAIRIYNVHTLAYARHLSPWRSGDGWLICTAEADCERISRSVVARSSAVAAAGLCRPPRASRVARVAVRVVVVGGWLRGRERESSLHYARFVNRAAEKLVARAKCAGVTQYRVDAAWSPKAGHVKAIYVNVIRYTRIRTLPFGISTGSPDRYPEVKVRRAREERAIRAKESETRWKSLRVSRTTRGLHLNDAVIIWSSKLGWANARRENADVGN